MLLALATLFLSGAVDLIGCPGKYDDHVQGIATDDVYNIYWTGCRTFILTDRCMMVT